jgi:hypothetical protein
MEKENAIPTWQFKHAHYMWVAKCNTCIMTLNPQCYLWEVNMQNPYVKHGTLLMEFDDHVKPIQGGRFALIRNKTITKHKKMIKKR